MGGYLWNNQQIHTSTPDFHELLHKQIKVGSIVIKKQEYKFPQAFTDDTVSLIGCIFIQCVTSPTLANGGGVYYENANAELVVSRSNFVECIARRVGGAIYASCEMIEIATTCFGGCRAMLTSMNCYANGKSSANIKMSLISEAGGHEKITGEHQVELSGTECTLSDTNTSYGFQLKSHGSLTFINIKKLTFERNHLQENDGPGLLYINGVENAKCETCNVIKNDARLEGLVLMKSKSLTINNFVFFYNSYQEIATAEEGAGGVNFIGCQFSEESKESIGGDAVFRRCRFGKKAETPFFFALFNEQKCNDVDADQVNGVGGIPKQTGTNPFTPSPPWLPGDVTWQQYGLLIFTILTVPIFVIIHLVTKNSEKKEIKALIN